MQRGKKTKYKIHNMQCKQGFTVQLAVIYREHGQEKTAAEASYFLLCPDSGSSAYFMN